MCNRLCSLIAAASILVAGCSSYRPADPQRAASNADNVSVKWPAREASVLEDLQAATPTEIYALEWIPGSDHSKATAQDRYFLENPDFVITHRGIHGQALLRLFEDYREYNRPTTAHRLEEYIMTRFGFRPNGSVITSRGIVTPASIARRRERQQVREIEAEVWRLEGRVVRRHPAPELSAITDGMPVRIPDPPSQWSGHRGLVIHFHSIQANPGERAVRQEMINRGWTVIDLQTDPRIATPVNARDEKRLAELESQANLSWVLATRGIKFTSVHGTQQRFAVDPRHVAGDWNRAVKEAFELREGSFELDPAADLNAIGRIIAQLSDDVAASNAYAAEAIITYLRQHRPQLLEGPIVLMGYSAGSLATPAAAIRLMRDMPDPIAIQAVVLVGSGADLFDISQKSALTDGGITLNHNGRRVRDQRVDAVHTSYLEHTQLDPVRLAPFLRSLPVLQVHASRDTWVHAAAGERLCEKLGRPDRLTVRGGHVRLFYTLSLYKDRIADWIEEHAPARDSHRASQ
jgi:hypothetical protein